MVVVVYRVGMLCKNFRNVFNVDIWIVAQIVPCPIEHGYDFVTFLRSIGVLARFAAKLVGNCPVVAFGVRLSL